MTHNGSTPPPLYFPPQLYDHTTHARPPTILKHRRARRVDEALKYVLKSLVPHRIKLPVSQFPTETSPHRGTTAPSAHTNNAAGLVHSCILLDCRCRMWRYRERSYECYLDYRVHIVASRSRIYLVGPSMSIQEGHRQGYISKSISIPARLCCVALTLTYGHNISYHIWHER